MLRRFKNILMYVDATSKRQIVLRRAVALARENGARLTLIEVLPEPKRGRAGMPADLRALALSRMEQELRRLAKAASKVGLRPEWRVLEGPPGVEVIKEVLRGGFDLLIKPHAETDPRRTTTYGPIDMQLLRQCPCPVWLVKPTRRKRFGRVLAAVDPHPEDPVQTGLNQKVMDLALSIAEADWSELYVLHVWDAFGEGLLKGRMKPAELQAYVRAARESAVHEMDAFLAPYRERLEAGQIAVVKGEAGRTIVEFVRRRQIDLTVMGTVARTGLAGLIMGNTAERVLSRIECSVLAVKPEGFESPVRGDLPGSGLRARAEQEQ